MLEEIIYAKLDSFVLKLAQGWRFQLVVEPMYAHHGEYAVLMWRPAE